MLTIIITYPYLPYYSHMVTNEKMWPTLIVPRVGVIWELVRFQYLVSVRSALRQNGCICVLLVSFAVFAHSTRTLFKRYSSLSNHSCLLTPPVSSYLICVCSRFCLGLRDGICAYGTSIYMLTWAMYTSYQCHMKIRSPLSLNLAIGWLLQVPKRHATLIFSLEIRRARYSLVSCIHYHTKSVWSHYDGIFYIGNWRGDFTTRLLRPWKV